MKIPRGDVEISRRADGLIEAGMLDVTHTIISTVTNVVSAPGIHTCDMTSE